MTKSRCIICKDKSLMMLGQSTFSIGMTVTVVAWADASLWPSTWAGEKFSI